MIFEVKDVVYLIVYAVTVAAFLFTWRNEVFNLKKELRRNQKIIYKDAGSLNLIDIETCKRHRDEIFTALRRSERTVEMLLSEIKEIKENMIIMMVHMGIKSPNGIKKD